MKVILIQGLLAPYRYPIFEQLSHTPNWNFEVWFMGKQVKNRIWNEDTLDKYHFNHRFLKGITVNFGFKDVYPIWFNFSIFNELKEAKPDVIMMMGWDSLTSFLVHLYCQLTKTPFVLYSDSTPLELSWRRSLTRPLVSWHVSTADALVAGGSRSKKYLEQLGAKASKIYISYNTIDVEKYRQMNRMFRPAINQIKDALHLPNKRIIMYYGQLIERKGVDLLIRSYAKIKAKYHDVALLVIGDGPDKKRLEMLCKKLNLSDVVILANPGDEVISRYYSVASLFVLPSREEVWGLVVNEAMVSGLPVIVSDRVGCAPDLIEDGKQGYIFKSGSIADLTHKLDECLSNESRRKTMARAASARIELFNPRFTIKQFREAIIGADPNSATQLIFKNPAQAGLVSVIIPVYRDPLGLVQTLNSLEHQENAPKFEIIIEHDQYGEGSYAARNRALSRSRGSSIAFIDAGSVADPNWLRSGYEALKKYDYVGGPIQRKIQLEEGVGHWAALFGLHREFAVQEFFTDAHFFPTTNSFVHRSVFKKLGGFDGRLHSSGDREFGERIHRVKQFTQHYVSNVIVSHPFRSYAALIKKQCRIARGVVDLAKHHPERFQIVTPMSLILWIIPPVWLLKKPSYQKLNFAEKIKVFLVTYHLSMVHHAEIIRYGFLRGR